MGWTKGQARDFAKRYVDDYARGARLLSAHMRNALLDSMILRIALLQDRESIEVAALSELRDMVRESIESKIGLRFFDED